MTELLAATRDALLKVGTSTLTGALYRRGFRNMFMQDVNALRANQPRMVGLAFTMRFIPSREDKNGPLAKSRSSVQPQAMEQCPPGHVLVVDSRGDARAASAGDLYIGRLKVAAEALATTLYDEFAEEEVARGRPLAGLFPVAGDEAKRDFEAWKARRGH